MDSIKLGFIDSWNQWKGVSKSYKMVLNSKDITVFIPSNFRIYAYTVGNPSHKSLIFEHPGSTFFKNFSLKDLHVDKSLAKQFVRNISTKQVKQWAKCFVRVPNA